ncbi:MAG: hypothetical protein LC791_10465 [Acidobacteria bacterium]|nr:hypothetical protein [Acidobacteriota bacterium]
MKKPLLGILVGAGLGLLDGLSAWASPEAQSMMMSIVIGSTVKGVLTGAMMGLVARRLRSLILGVLVGLSCGGY